MEEHTSVAGDMIVSRKVHGKFHESRWHRGNEIRLTVLDRVEIFCQVLFFYFVPAGIKFRYKGGLQMNETLEIFKIMLHQENIKASSGQQRTLC